MDNYPSLWKNLFSTPSLLVLDFLSQNQDLELHDSDISFRIKGVRKTAVNVALRTLAKMGLVERSRKGRMVFNRLLDSPFTQQYKTLSHLALLQPLVEKLKALSIKIVLFGSRATGSYRSDSDIDLLIVSDDIDKIQQIVRKSPLEEKLQLIIKSLSEWIALPTDDESLYHSIRKGIVLWEKP